MSPESLEESTKAETGRPEPIKIDPSAHTYSLALTDPKGTPSEQEKIALEEDTYFPQDGSVIIIDALDPLKATIDDYSVKMGEYNTKLTEAGVKYQIRALHENKYRHKTYWYFGKYIYEQGIGPVQEPKTPTITDMSNIKICKVCDSREFSLKGYTQHIKGKKHKDRLNGIEENKVRLEYVRRYHPVDWKGLVAHEVLVDIGMPPRSDLPNMNFHIVSSNGSKTKTIVMPYLLFMNSILKSKLSKCTYFQLI